MIKGRIGGGFFARPFSTVNNWGVYFRQTGVIADTWTDWDPVATYEPGVTAGGRWVQLQVIKDAPIATGVLHFQVGIHQGGAVSEWLPGNGQSFRLSNDNFFNPNPYYLSFPFVVPKNYLFAFRIQSDQAAVSTLALNIYIFN